MTASVTKIALKFVDFIIVPQRVRPVLLQASFLEIHFSSMPSCGTTGTAWREISTSASGRWLMVSDFNLLKYLKFFVPFCRCLSHNFVVSCSSSSTWIENYEKNIGEHCVTEKSLGFLSVSLLMGQKRRSIYLWRVKDIKFTTPEKSPTKALCKVQMSTQRADLHINLY